MADEAMTSSICWFYNRNDIYLLGSCDEFAYGLNYEDSKYRHLELDDFTKFVLQNKGAKPITVIARAKNYNDWKKDLPEPALWDSNGDRGFVFAQF